MTEDSKTRVLFVEDDAGALNWLERSLQSMKNRWEMTFVESGERALELIAQSSQEVIVSDMRMPGMSGAELLRQLKEKYPETIRLIIADYADRSSVVECVGIAHQFLSKPCYPDELRSAIDRACAFNSSIKGDRIKNILAKMEFLPSMPSVLHELLQLLQREDAQVEEVGAIIARDIAMTANLLRLVNSGFFGLQTEISRPAEAVSYLGLKTVKALMLTTQAFSSFEKKETGPISLEVLWRHSLAVAGAARNIAEDSGAERGMVEESFIAGMLHDIGKLALATNLPGQYQSVFAAAENLGLSLHAAEEAAFGAHHGDIGGHMLSLWGLPPRVVNAIKFHHEPHLEGADEFTPAVAVHIANGLTHEAAVPGMDFLNSEYLNELGIADSVPRWRELAAA